VNRDDANATLRSGDFDQFVGTPETLELELAKDVSAFANASGGVIIIGAQTEHDDNVTVDVVNRLRLLRQGLVNEQQYEGIVNDMVYPRLRDVQVRFHPYAVDRERGLVSIDVPPQEEAEKYFLIQRPIEESPDRTPGWLVGIAVRNIGRVEERRIGELHTMINRGLFVGRQLEDVANGVTELRELLLPGATDAASSPADRLDSVVESRIKEIAD
jgi:hypothetical protein